MSEHPNFTGLPAFSFSQPEKYARRLLGIKEFDTDASICSSSWCRQTCQNTYKILLSLWFPHWTCRFRLAFEPPCQMVMQNHKGGWKEEWKRSLYGRGLRWVKICAFSNLGVLSTSFSCACTCCVEAVLTAKWHLYLDWQSENLHCILENTDRLMIPLLLEMVEGKKRCSASAYHRQKKPRCPRRSTLRFFPQISFFLNLFSLSHEDCVQVL